MCSANAQGRSPEGAVEWGRKGKKKVKGRGKEWEEVESGVTGGERGRGAGKEGRKGGEGSGSQAALYPDRSPLHTNFLVKEEKMALNPEKSFSPGAGLSAEG